MEYTQITSDIFKVGDIIKLKNNFDYLSRTSDYMLKAANRYVIITSVSAPDYWCNNGYLRCKGYLVDNDYISDWNWYPEHIDHIATQEEIEQVTALFEQTLILNNTQYYKCDICGKYTSTPTTHEDKTYCPLCKKSHLTECAYCHKIYLKNNTPLHAFNFREYICDDCLCEHEDDIFWCNAHGRYENGDPQHAPNGDVICEDAFWDIYTTCDCCGDIVDRYCIYYDDDDKYAYCEDCWHTHYADRTYNHVCNYHNHVRLKYGDVVDDKLVYRDRDPDFKGYGIELEVDVDADGDYKNEDDRDEIVSDISEMTNRAFYYQDDRSLSDCGIEIISHPHTKAALDKLPLEDMCKYLIENDYSSHNAGCCGLHVHISRKLFGENVDEQDDKILKMVQFYHHFWDDIVKFSRRKNFNYCDKLPVTTDEDMKNFVKNKNGDRYVAINLTNTRADTVEVRVMRGTLNAKTLRATLDFVAHIAERSKTIDDSDIKDSSKWLEGISDRCVEYMKKRGCFGYTADNMNEEV